MNRRPLVGVVIYWNKKQGVTLGENSSLRETLGRFYTGLPAYLWLRDGAVFGSSGGTGSDGRAAAVDVIRGFLLLDWISKGHTSRLKSQKGKTKVTFTHI